MAVTLTLGSLGKSSMMDEMRDKITHVAAIKEAAGGFVTGLQNVSTDGKATVIQLDHDVSIYAKFKTKNTIDNDPILFGVKDGNALHSILLGKYGTVDNYTGFQVYGVYVPNIPDKGYDWFYHVRYIESEITSGV